MTSGGDRPYWVLTVSALTAVLVINILNSVHEFERMGRPIAAWKPAVWEFSSGAVLLALAPAVVWLTRRSLASQAPVWLRLVPHVPAAVVFSFLHVALAGPIRTAAYAAMGERYAPWAPLGDWPYELRKDVIVYAVFAGLYWLWRRSHPLAQPALAAGEPVLEVRDGPRRHLIPLADIEWIEAAGNYVEVHTPAKQVLHRAPLSRLEQELAGSGLVRIHRSRLVNRAQVAEIEAKPTGDFDVVLRSGQRLGGSRRFRDALG
ncbi:MAG TPA: LytTR family DNA-binding domain-containing protein [Phenylobacterium sp.]